ncbi:MAG TPA: TlpA disulfide reductase family protein [Candidatus Limnocylindrales bacterium]|nr:TlpA disulfide reductase family protein [Candidatus Limnocylindrales bacterium]
MSTRSTVAVGLLAGLVVGLVAWLALVALGPVPQPSATPPPSLSLPTPPPAASASTATPSPAASAPPASVSPAGSAAALFGVGERAPALRVPQLAGGTIDLAALSGKPVWVNFMATWCPPCRDELPVMNGFAARYGSNGLVVVAIDVKEDEAVVAPFMTSLGMSIPVGLDGDGSAQQAWRAAALPVHFWIDAQGIVRDGALGGIGPDVMAKGLGRILPGVTVTP